MLKRKFGQGLGCLILLGLAFIGIAAMLGLVQAGRVRGEAHDIARLYLVDTAPLATSATGTPLAATGRLTGDPDDDVGLLVYTEQEWRVEYDDEDSWEGHWQTLRTVVPACTLELTAGRLPVNPRPDVTLSLTPREITVYVPTYGDEVDGIVAGTIRRLGFEPGDLVTIVGTTAPEGVDPTRIAGGTRDDLVAHLSQQVTTLRLVGAALALVGTIMLVSALLIRRK